MSESLRNDGRIWVPKKRNDNRHPNSIPEEERDYYLERRYPAYGNLAPRDIASRAAKERIDEGFGVGKLKNAVYLDFSKALAQQGLQALKDKYGNLFEMYHHITDIDAYQEPMLISPAAHFAMGGLWVDYNLMTSIPGVFALGEANCADHGANRLGANSLLQACVDGYYIIPNTLMAFFAENGNAPTDTAAAFEKSIIHWKETFNRWTNNNGKATADQLHRKLGAILYQKCGLSRNAAGLKEALSQIQELQEDFESEILIPGNPNQMNVELEKAGRLRDFIELAYLMTWDALDRQESCGAHFREEYQTQDGEPLRNDEEWGFVSAWEYQQNAPPKRHEDILNFETVAPTQRSYK
jgi:succinate dehydrogenase / fumarate reductase flavoprotein subunit